MNKPDSFIETRSLSKLYRSGSEDVQALNSVDIAIQKGEFVSIVGPSGCGKSTLLYVLGGLTTPTSGIIRIDGKEIHRGSDAALSRHRGRTIGFVFQRFNLIPTLSIHDNIGLAQKIRGMDPRRGISEILERVGLGAKQRRKPFELSMGEQQRAAIARAVIHRPAILLADEPTGNLDSANSESVLELFAQMHRGFGQTILMVTHNDDVARAAGRTIHMKDGRIAAPPRS